MRRGMWPATAALVLTVVAGAWLALAPCFYRGISESGPSEGAVTRVETCKSLVEMNGLWVIGLFLVPVVICLLALDATRRGWRGATLAFALVLFAFCVVGMFSVGFWFVPSAWLIGLAAARQPRRTPAMAETS